MADRTEKQKEASRRNGAESPGPTTDQGKDKIKFNAAKDWLFTKEIVVTAAGERQADFDRVKNETFDYIDPQNPLEVMCTSDRRELAA